MPNGAGRNSPSPLLAHLEGCVSISKGKVVENLDEDFLWNAAPQVRGWSKHAADSVGFKNWRNFQNCSEFSNNPLAGGASLRPSQPRRGGSGGAEAGRRRREVLKMAGSSTPWIGSAYLFLQSTCKTIILPNLYESAQKKPCVFKALKLALADSTGSMNGVDVLKVHCSHPHLIVQLKFCKQENCRRFLQSYREGELQKSLQNHLQLSLAMTTVPLEMELKAGNEHLDSMLKDEDRCLECIYREKPDRLRDEEITELEERLKSLILHQNINNNMPSKDCMSLNSPSLPSQGSSLSPQVTFLFQGQQFDNRTLTPDDHQKFAKLVSKKWKQVGRSLQKNCRALRDPVIDNLAHEYDREGLYEQAYQMLLRFIQSEGKKATIARLIAALEENGLTSLSEELLGLHSNEDDS